MKLQGRITVANTVMVIITVITFSLIQLWGFHQNSDQILQQTTKQVSDSLLEQLKQRAEYTAGYLSDALINPMYTYDMEGIHALLEPALKSDEVLEIKVFDVEGNIFHTGARVDSSYGSPLANYQVEQQVLKESRDYCEVEGDTLMYSTPLYIGDELMGGLYLKLSLTGINKHIAETRGLIENIGKKAQRTSTFGSLLLAIVFSSISIIVSYVITRTIISPIISLVAHARRISEGNYDRDNTIVQDDELGELASAFNEMSANLQDRTQAIEFLAYHDHLTELPNKTLFIKQLERQIGLSRVKQQRLAVLFIDLDEFKSVNDSYGHHAGDSLLCEVARRLKSKLEHYPPKTSADDTHRKGSLIARIGGDEFLLCLPYQNTPNELYLFVEELITSISQPITVGQEKENVVVSGSVGISLYPEDGHDAEELIKHADIAMYEAKADGKRTYSHFTDHMRQQVRHKAWIERKLRMAMDDMSQFEVWYQPFFDLRTNTLLGAEALIRWRIPDKGLLAPSEFISIAETTGLIVPIGEWVTKSVCAQLIDWEPYLSDQFYVSINLSAKQLYRQQIVDVFRGELELNRIPVSRLHAEVTESLLMQNEEESVQTLISLRELGIQIWLDDFGTGYSSLGYLRKFQVDGLKIDRSFVCDLEQDANDRALCSTIISMAADLNLEVVAEGIETQEQVSFLQQKGCWIGQGDIYAPALTAQEFEKKFMG